MQHDTDPPRRPEQLSDSTLISTASVFTFRVSNPWTRVVQCVLSNDTGRSEVRKCHFAVKICREGGRYNIPPYLQPGLRYRPLRRNEIGPDQMSVSLRGDARPPAPAIRGRGWLVTDSVLPPLRNLAGRAVPGYFRRNRWTNSLPLNTEALNATQAKVPLDDLAHLEDKTAEGTPLACITSVS